MEADNADQYDHWVTEGLAALPPRQRQAMDRAVAGWSNRSIALDMGIKVRTVESHLAMVYARFGAVNRADLMRILIASPSGQRYILSQVASAHAVGSTDAPELPPNHNAKDA